MARIEATAHIDAPPARVWAVLTDWEGQPRWMRDARSVEVTSARREGVGVELRCRTGIAGLVVADDMVTTEWRTEEVLAIRHTGRLIRGVGAFELTPTPHGTRLVWWEEVDPPLGAAGEAFTTLLVAPVVTRVFRASVARLKRICESSGVRG